MYYSYFGLTQPPFRITPNTEFFYGGGNRGPILEALIYAIGQGEGIVKVTGEVGSGKTMLCKAAAAALLKVNQPKVSALLSYKLDGFSVERLMTFLTALDRDVEISIKKKARSHSSGRISVIAA